MKAVTRRTLSATSLMSDKVKNPEGDDLGTIKDLMIDLESGQIAYAVLSFGGFLGMGNKLFAIPWRALSVRTEDHSLRLDATEEQLKNAEGFDPSEWPDMADQSWGQRQHDYYGVTPYWQ